MTWDQAGPWKGFLPTWQRPCTNPLLPSLLGALLNKVDLQILRLYPNTNTIVPMACAHIAFLLFLLYYLLAQVRREAVGQLNSTWCTATKLEDRTTWVYPAVASLRVPGCRPLAWLMGGLTQQDLEARQVPTPDRHAGGCSSTTSLGSAATRSPRHL